MHTTLSILSAKLANLYSRDMQIPNLIELRRATELIRGVMALTPTYSWPLLSGMAGGAGAVISGCNVDREVFAKVLVAE